MKRLQFFGVLVALLCAVPASVAAQAKTMTLGPCRAMYEGQLRSQANTVRSSNISGINNFHLCLHDISPNMASLSKSGLGYYYFFDGSKIETSTHMYTVLFEADGSGMAFADVVIWSNLLCSAADPPDICFYAVISKDFSDTGYGTSNSSWLRISGKTYTMLLANIRAALAKAVNKR